MARGPGSRALELAAATWLAVVLIATLAPVEGGRPIEGLCFICGTYGMSDLAVNLAMLAPLGVLIALRWPGSVGALAVAGLPVGIEFLQLAIPGRHATPSDALFNVIGLGLGYASVGAARGFESRYPGGLLAIWSGGVALVPLFFGLLHEPALPDSDYFVVWNPDLRVIQPYPGEVLSTDLGGISLGPGGPVDGAPIAEALERGETFSARFLAVPSLDGEGLFGIAGMWDQQRREVLLLGVRGGELFVRAWRRGDQWRMRSWSRPVVGALGPAEVGETSVSVRLAPEGHFCVELTPGGTRCDTRVSAGSWWTALFAVPSDDWVPWLSRAALALILLPLGLLSGGRWGRIVAGGVALAAFAVAPGLYPLAPLTVVEWGLLMAGPCLGLAIRAATRQCWMRATP